jgi:phospholipase C
MPIIHTGQNQDGLSTVTTDGEITVKEQHGVPAGNPIGLGFRVPLFIISPWTRGNLGTYVSCPRGGSRAHRAARTVQHAQCSAQCSTQCSAQRGGPQWHTL